MQVFLRSIAVLLVAIGCDRHPDAEMAVGASASGSGVPLLDVEAASRCEVRYACGLSHPGLGTSMDSMSVDLATCTKTTSSVSGPFGGAAGTSDTSSATIVIQPAHCASLKGLVSSITADDAKREQEPAQIDTAACTLTVTCKPNAAPVIDVQRQTLTGPGSVTKLIQALQRAH